VVGVTIMVRSNLNWERRMESCR